ncbi:MAG: hypothetical protein RBS39_13440 [Phycisphaerales bacterium]|jgi:uncharacterized membrane protein|nr:hypothetical protein [Phycisphaerales bacterium]
MPSKLAVVPLALAAPVFAQSARWEYVEIPRGDADGILLRGVNEQGHAVGIREWGAKSLGTYRSQPFLWDGSQRIDFENPANGSLVPAGITNDGTIYANLLDLNGQPHAGVLSSGGFTGLSFTGGAPDGSAVVFVHPDSGFIVNEIRAGVYSPSVGFGGAVVEAVASPVDGSFQATSFNRTGQIAGFTRVNDRTHSYSLRDDRFELLSLPPGYEDAYATGINESGDMVGTVHDANGNLDPQAVRWTAGDAEVLPLPGPGWGFASRINDVGDVAGSIYIPGDPSHTGAVVWSGGDVLMVAQHVVGLPAQYPLHDVAAITDSGFLLVSSQISFGENGSQTITILLRPIPSPGAWVLVALGLGLSASRRRARAERVTP